MLIADQPIAQEQPVQTEPTFDLEQTILDLVAVVESMGIKFFNTPQQAAAMDRLRELAKQMGLPVISGAAVAVKRKATDD